MSLEILLSHVIKDIGILTERVNSLETCLLNSTIREETGDYEDDDLDSCTVVHDTHRFTYPISGKVDDDSTLNMQQCRFLQSTMYKVQIFKPFDQEIGSPVVVTLDMTRDELDDFIAKNPGKNFKEYLISIKPLLEDFL